MTLQFLLSTPYLQMPLKPNCRPQVTKDSFQDHSIRLWATTLEEMIKLTHQAIDAQQLKEMLPRKVEPPRVSGP
jgi:hypothetical protein